MSFPPQGLDTAPAPSPADTVATANPLAAIGALGILISIFTEWGTDALFGESFAGEDIPIEFLNDTTPSSLDSTSIVFFLVPAVVAIAIGMVVAKARWLTIAGGVGALVVALLYVRAVSAAVDYYDFDAGLSDLIGAGTWICAIGGVLAAIGGVMTIRRRP